MAEKMLPCCARAHHRVQQNKSEIARLAKNASRFAANGKSTKKTLELIAAEKASLEQSLEALVDHEAAHADESAA